MTRTVTVRAVRPHDTTLGMKALGEEYERSAADGKQLAEVGIVTIVADAPKGNG